MSDEIKVLRAEVAGLKAQLRDAKKVADFWMKYTEQLEESESNHTREFLTDVMTRATSSGGQRPSSRSLDLVKLFWDTVTVFNKQPEIKKRFKSSTRNRYAKLITALEKLDENTYLKVDQARIRESLKTLFADNC